MIDSITYKKQIPQILYQSLKDWAADINTGIVRTEMIKLIGLGENTWEG